MYDFLIVGAGFSGAVLAERIASQLDARVLLVDKRSHVGGNAFDAPDRHGVVVHAYGPHVFHTSSERVVEYLSRFTTWTPYRHRVLADVDGLRVPIPINRNTINRLYGFALSTPAEVEAYLASVRMQIDRPQNAEEAVLSKVGVDLYERIYRGYSTKHWGLEPRMLLASVTGRIPVRTDTDDSYFTDWFQQQPGEGYRVLFERMLDHPRIELSLGTDFQDVKSGVRYGHLIYTGPIDWFFKCRYGPLPYRSVRFESEYHTRAYAQESPVINYTNGHPCTRTTEWKRITGQRCPGTTVTSEYPCWADRDASDPYYPVPTSANQKLYRRYWRDAAELSDVTFCGRLGEYRYLDMDEAVANALDLFARRIARRPASR